MRFMSGPGAGEGVQTDLQQGGGACAASTKFHPFRFFKEETFNYARSRKREREGCRESTSMKFNSIYFNINFRARRDLRMRLEGG